MKAGAWREQAINAVREADAGDARMLDRLALSLDQQDAATQRLRELGYGWTGLGLLETVDLVPAAPSGGFMAGDQGAVSAATMQVYGDLADGAVEMLTGQRATVRPGDVLVVCLQGGHTERQCTGLARTLEAMIGGGVKVMVINEQVSISAVLHLAAGA